MHRLRWVVVSLLTAGLVMAGVGVSSAAAKQLSAPKNVLASATSTTSISVSFSPVVGASSYTAYLYAATGSSSQPIPNAIPAGTSITGLSLCTSYRVSVQALSSSRNVLNSVQSGKVSVTTQCNPALVPTFATPTPTSDGFRVRITNYDPAYTWSGAVAAGSVTIECGGLAIVSGLTSDSAETLTVTTTRATYDSGSATISSARNTTPLTTSRWIGAGDFTVDLWVKPTVTWAPPARQELLALTTPSLQKRIDIAYTEAGKWQVLGFPWTTPPESAVMAPPAVGQWTHVAVTRQSGVMRLYVAGQKIAEASASEDFSDYSQLVLGADPNNLGFTGGFYLAQARLSNVRVLDGTALYTCNAITVPTSSLAAVTGTTFLLNNALGDPTVGSVEFNGTLRYQQAITIVDSSPLVSAFAAYFWDGSNWQSASVVTSTDSPFIV